MDRKNLLKIYRKPDGCCHICHAQLSFSCYGKHGMKRSWHIEHSKARANGGTDHYNNLYPACISCNCEKGKKSTRTMRRKYGTDRAPYSKTTKQRIKDEHTVMGMVGGGLVGIAFGPAGIMVGSILGGLFGEDLSPNR